MLKRRLQQLVDDPSKGPGRLFGWFIQLTIIVSILNYNMLHRVRSTTRLFQERISLRLHLLRNNRPPRDHALLSRSRNNHKDTNTPSFI